jgi:cell wall-associated NlpC family hydrolase
MFAVVTRSSSSSVPLLAGGALASLLAITLTVSVFLLTEPAGRAGACQSVADGSIALGPPGTGRTVGATEYGGPADSSSGHVGSSGVNLLDEPDSYAELGGDTFATADAMGGLPYGTPLRVTWASHSVIAYKRDIGLGGGPVDGYPRAIDLWWELAGRLGIPYEHGEWSGPVRVARTPLTGAGATLGQTPAAEATGSTQACASLAAAVVSLVPGGRARLLPDGLAAAPAGAPPAVRRMIAAGNQIVGKPYVYGGGHGLPLSEIAPSYDCSSSVDHILYGGGLLPVASTPTSGELESFGRPGPGRWVTLYASQQHVFMYVAGLRWDTWNAAGPGDGTTGIGWHPLVRNADGFIARHPAGL